jgi:hypothetical protein
LSKFSITDFFRLSRSKTTWGATSIKRDKSGFLALALITSIQDKSKPALP